MFGMIENKSSTAYYVVLFNYRGAERWEIGNTLEHTERDRVPQSRSTQSSLARRQWQMRNSSVFAKVKTGLSESSGELR